MKRSLVAVAAVLSTISAAAIAQDTVEQAAKKAAPAWPMNHEVHRKALCGEPLPAGVALDDSFFAHMREAVMHRIDKGATFDESIQAMKTAACGKAKT